jgi:hypothetical protein
MKMNAHNETRARGIHPELEGKSTHRSRTPRPPSSVIRSFHSGPRPRPPRRPHPPLLVSSSSSYLILALALSALLSPPPSAASLPMLLAAALTAATGRALLMLDQRILLVVALLLFTVRRRRPGRHLMAACASVCAHHGVPSATATLGLALDLGGAHTTPHHGAHDSAFARETTPWWALPRWGARHAHDSARHAVVLFSDEYRWSGICFGTRRGWGGLGRAVLSRPPPLADRACERHAEHHRKQH